jgi:hypothetical protein
MNQAEDGINKKLNRAVQRGGAFLGSESLLFFRCFKRKVVLQAAIS